MIRNLEELSPLEKLGLIEMSYSRLSTYAQCPAKFFYSYIVREPRKFGEAATAGSAVHTVLEHADLNNLGEENLQERLVAAWEEHDPEGWVGPDYRKLAEDLLDLFVDRHEGQVFDTIGKELEFKVVIGRGFFRGFIDRVDHQPNGGLLIEDYKTGKHQVAQKNAHLDLQLGLYAVVAHHLYPDAWPVRANLYYLRTNKKIGHTYSEADLARIEETLSDLVEQLVSLENFSYTKDEWTCRRLCDFTDLCPRGRALLHRR